MVSCVRTVVGRYLGNIHNEHERFDRIDLLGPLLLLPAGFYTHVRRTRAEEPAERASELAEKKNEKVATSAGSALWCLRRRRRRLVGSTCVD